MDPDANLKTQLDLADKILKADKNGSDFALDALALAEKVKELDDWMRGAGYLPKPWHEALLGRVLT